MHRRPARGEACVLIAASGSDAQLRECERSLRAHVPEGTAIVRVPGEAAEVNRVLARLAPADVVVLVDPCVVSEGWLERMRAAARGETNTASASAFADVGGPLAVADERRPEALEALARRAGARKPLLRPRLHRPAGPCVYLRRDAIELAGALDEELDLRAALELDFGRRCMLSGLSHVAADDVVVRRLGAPPGASEGERSVQLRERYPYLADTAIASSGVLGQVLRELRDPPARLDVTIDARALGAAVTGTQVHVLELIQALAGTGALRLRVLVSVGRLGEGTREQLQALPETLLLAEEDVTAGTPPTAVFHRPQQTFSTGDVELAVRLGARVVVSQLDLIAYSNPGYFENVRAWEDYRRANRQGLSASVRVVVFSEHTRGELLSDSLVEEDRIRVVPPGLDHATTAQTRRPAALEPSSGAFLLCLGTDFRHKNRPFALRTLAALRERHGWQGRLVFAGTHVQSGSSCELERAVLEEHPAIRDAVLDLGAVDEAERAWLMANAVAVLYPSVYEGFGLVPFEAALGGIPCVFAPQASLADVAPRGTATIVPWDPARSADAAHALLSNASARELHVDALARAARELTWHRAAASLVEIYAEAARAPLREAATASRDAARREAELLDDREALIRDHDALVARLVEEREHARAMYDRLNAKVGDGLSLIGPRGSLPEDVQRALLALSARPRLSRPLYACAASIFGALRALARPLQRLR